ncbi:hypothetical protein [Sulfitobacter sp.]|uniref:hypothetical protein n=1 Tax=Sulfitobacter sp. TaxID=1903071 RepID=UPI003EF54475
MGPQPRRQILPTVSIRHVTGKQRLQRNNETLIRVLIDLRTELTVHFTPEQLANHVTNGDFARGGNMLRLGEEGAGEFECDRFCIHTQDCSGYG